MRNLIDFTVAIEKMCQNKLACRISFLHKNLILLAVVYRNPDDIMKVFSGLLVAAVYLHFSLLHYCHLCFQLPVCPSQRKKASPWLVPQISSVLWRFHDHMTVSTPVEFPPCSPVRLMCNKESHHDSQPDCTLIYSLLLMNKHTDTCLPISLLAHLVRSPQCQADPAA